MQCFKDNQQEFLQGSTVLSIKPNTHKSSRGYSAVNHHCLGCFYSTGFLSFLHFSLTDAANPRESGVTTAKVINFLSTLAKIEWVYSVEHGTQVQPDKQSAFLPVHTEKNVGMYLLIK